MQSVGKIANLEDYFMAERELISWYGVYNVCLHPFIVFQREKGNNYVYCATNPVTTHIT